MAASDVLLLRALSVYVSCQSACQLQFHRNSVVAVEIEARARALDPTPVDYVGLQGGR